MALKKDYTWTDHEFDVVVSLSTGACRSRGRTKARFISARSADTPQKWAMARPYSALARRLTAPVTLCCTRFMANP